MIARVRIAPMERWCWWYEGGKKHHSAPKLVGLPVEIITNSMRPACCDSKARMWDITAESEAEVERIVGKPNIGGYGICEHMLEMD